MMGPIQCCSRRFSLIHLFSNLLAIVRSNRITLVITAAKPAWHSRHIWARDAKNERQESLESLGDKADDEPTMALSLTVSSLAGLSTVTLSFAAAAEASSTLVSSYAPVGSPTSVPYGWADFCRRYAGECDSGPLAPLDISLTPRKMKEIGRVGQ
jgi:Bacterial transglutaminase-like cysteine proteinase BTLCP